MQAFVVAFFLLSQKFAQWNEKQRAGHKAYCPAGRKVKNVSGCPEKSSQASATTRFGGVPMSVSMPPRLLAKAGA